MDTPRLGSRGSAAGPGRVFTRRYLAGILLLGVAVCASADLACAHTTQKELKERAERARACDRDAEGAEAFDLTRLGTSLATLRARFADALVAQTMERPKSALERRMEKEASAVAPETGIPRAGAPERRDPYVNQARFRRSVAQRDVLFAEYDLYDGRVYRIRWRLDDRFSVPIMGHLVSQATACYGEPAYDQEPEWKLSDGKSKLRRSGWERGERLLELRQLHPLGGGAVFVTVTDLAIVRAIVAAQGFASPDPETSPPWWMKPQAARTELSAEEREGLVHDFTHVLSLTEFSASEFR